MHIEIIYVFHSWGEIKIIPSSKTFSYSIRITLLGDNSVHVGSERQTWSGVTGWNSLSD